MSFRRARIRPSGAEYDDLVGGERQLRHTSARSSVGLCSAASDMLPFGYVQSAYSIDISLVIYSFLQDTCSRTVYSVQLPI